MEKSSVEILVIEDEPAQAQLIMAMLAESRKPEVSVQLVSNLGDGLSLLGSRNFDVILIDVSFPDNQRVETALVVRNQARHTPVIVMTDDEEVGLKALQLDIQDYLIKVEINASWLKRSIRYAIQRQCDIEAQRKCEQCFSSLMHNLPIAAWMKDLSGRYSHGNEQHQRVFGMPFTDYSGKTDEEILPQDTARKLRENDAEVASTGESLHTTEVLCLPDGTERHFVVTKFPVAGTDGRTAYVGGIAMDITDRVKAEEVLHLSEARFRTLHDDNPAMIFTLDAEGTIISTNSACTDHLGYSVHELTGQSIFELFHEDDRSVMVEHLKLCRQNPDQLYRRQLRKICKNGELLWVEEMARAIYDLNGAVNVLVVCQDITERKRAEEALQKSEKKFATVFKEAPALLAISTLKDGMFVDVNETMLRTLGYRREEMIGRSSLDLGLWERPSERAVILETLEETGSAKNIEVRFSEKNGQSHICLFSAEYISINGDRYMLSLVEDVTHRKLMEDALKQREETLRLFVEHSPVPMVMVDKEMKYIYASRRWFETFGLKDVDVRDRSHYEIFPDIPERWKEVHRRCLAGATERNESDHWQRADGTSVWNHWEITPWYKMENEIGGLVIVVEDITERKQTEQEVERLNSEIAARAVELAEANRELEAFNYTVAHDLRNPLNLIYGYSQMITRLCGANLDDECRGYHQQIADSILGMNKLISALLDFSRLARSEPRRDTIDISAMALTVAARLRQGAPERSVDFRISEGVVVNGDRELLRVVMDNLLGNAWKYTAMRDEAIIEFGVTEIDGQATCYVRDNGPGFATADAEELFVPFKRGAATAGMKGFGIGLATVDRIIRRHGGRIWAEGELGKGATFYFTLAA